MSPDGLTGRRKPCKRFDGRSSRVNFTLLIASSWSSRSPDQKTIRRRTVDTACCLVLCLEIDSEPTPPLVRYPQCPDTVAPHAHQPVVPSRAACSHTGSGSSACSCWRVPCSSAAGTARLRRTKVRPHRQQPRRHLHRLHLHRHHLHRHLHPRLTSLPSRVTATATSRSTS